MFRGKRIISGIMLVLMLVSFIGCKRTSKAATFTYEENAAGNIVITGLTDKGRADAKVIVPAKIDGKKVDGIGSGVFRDDTTVTDVVISDGISYIAENVFLSCYNLKQLRFRNQLILLELMHLQIHSGSMTSLQITMRLLLMVCYAR